MESLVFYKSFYEAIQQLPEGERLAAYDAVISYGITGEEPAVEGLAKIVFTMAKPQIDANIERQENGKRGGRPRKNPEEKTEGIETKKPLVFKNENQRKENQKPNDNVNVNINENINDNKPYMRELEEAIANFKDHRKKMRKPMTDKAVELFTARLNKLTTDPRRQIELINTAIERGWQTVYLPDRKTGEIDQRKNSDKLQELERRALKGGA